MVRAILAGTKTQTRRLIKPQPAAHHYLQSMWGTSPPPDPTDFGTKWLWREVGPDYPDDREDDRRCPYGVPGDRLWVRETWQESDSGPDYYAADYESKEQAGVARWRPSIFMPRRTSRITLEITNVRAEQLHDITEEDAKAEGARDFFEQLPGISRDQTLTSGERADGSPVRAGYAVLWDEINGDRATWKTNPWVWAVSFKRAL
jgi:hypothetical protein